MNAKSPRISILSIVSRLALCVGLAPLLLSGCRKDDPFTDVQMPATPVLAVRANWAVVTSPYLRIRSRPSQDGEVVAHLRNSSVAEVLAKTTYPESVEGQTNYWYEISSDGLRGWVFGSYLEFHDSRAGAEKASTRKADG
ncbi:MAG: Bacterial SH3 domain protein [Synergistetes bacterium ADurb.Bin520]|nr:MAG: Bacterial SH3 domain protein [Synergistetes bacterium ADurb.Bin520]